MEKLKPITEWSLSVDLRIRVRVADGKMHRTLQQRWTRIALDGDGTKIEEKWVDVPVVEDYMTQPERNTK